MHIIFRIEEWQTCQAILNKYIQVWKWKESHVTEEEDKQGQTVPVSKVLTDFLQVFRRSSFMACL